MLFYTGKRDMMKSSKNDDRQEHAGEKIERYQIGKALEDTLNHEVGSDYLLASNPIDDTFSVGLEGVGVSSEKINEIIEKVMADEHVDIRLTDEDTTKKEGSVSRVLDSLAKKIRKE